MIYNVIALLISSSLKYSTVSTHKACLNVAPLADRAMKYAKLKRQVKYRPVSIRLYPVLI